MARIAIHPTTLDLKEFKPGRGLQHEGYLVFKDAAELAEKGGGFIDNLARRIMGKNRKKPKSRATLATILWPDIVIHALHDNQFEAMPDEVLEPAKKEKKPKGETRGRGNFKPRIPDFTLTGNKPDVSLPPQAEILCMELNKLYQSGTRRVEILSVKDLIKTMKLPTQQDPMRIFRYYFWLIVRAGVIAVEGEPQVDVVVRHNAKRHKFEVREIPDLEEYDDKDAILESLKQARERRAARVKAH